MTAPDHPLWHSAARPTPRLYLVKACALLFVAFPLLALAAPARAGHWVLTTTGSGQAMIGSGGMVQNFTPPTPSTNSVTIGNIAAGADIGPSFSYPPYAITASANLQVTVTGTWTSDTNSDNTPPPGVWLSESSTARATCTNAGVRQAGSADDGWGDAVAQSGSQIGTSAPPSGQKYVKQSGGSFKANLTLSASASGTQGMFQGDGEASASVGPITIAIHAQPYNFHQVRSPSVDNTSGSLHFYWGWSSTDGNVSSLSSCTVYEYITWSGDGSSGTTVDGRSAWAPNHPPVGAGSQGGVYAYPSPVIQPDPNASGGNATIGTADDLFSAPNFVSPCQGPSATWTGHQVYYFNDPATGQTMVKIPSPVATDDEDDITRSVTQRTTHTWRYDVTSRGVSASILPLP